MTSNQTHTFNPESNLDAVIAEFLRAREAGDNPAPEVWIEQHPELANDLREFFADHERLEEMTQALRQDQNVDRIRYFGDYELHGEIARGGMGVVYRARQVSVNRPVAVKMILTGQLASENDVLRFRNEAELAANLDHPNVVPVYEVGEHQGQHYFSMKLIEGGNLSTYQTRYLDKPKDAARLMIKVVSAVHHAHQRGLLHRDLKPGNVLIDVHGEPHVTDFGLAKQIIRSEGSEPGKQELTQSGAIVGTPAYASPEQVRGEKALTTASDVYGLGAILYVLLTGKAPFENENVLDTIQQVLDTDPVRPQSHNPRVPRDLQTICLKCMAKEPHRRYGGADQLADELQRFCNGEPIEARRVRPPERVWRWCRRHPAVASLLALVVVLLLTGSAISTYFAIEANWQASKAHQARARAEKLASREAALKMQAQTQALLAKTSRHALQISTALQAWKRHDVFEADRILAEIAPEFANAWESRHLRSLCQRKGLLLPVRVEESTAVAISSEGEVVATESTDNDEGTVDLWSASGRKLRSLKGEITVPMGILFSSDGTRVAARGWAINEKGLRNLIQIWSTSTGKLACTLSIRDCELSHFALSLDGKQMVTVALDLESEDKPATVTVWDVTTGKEIRSMPAGMLTINDVTFNVNGEEILVVGEDGTVRGWSIETGKETLSRKPKERVFASVFSPDGKTIASERLDNQEEGTAVEVTDTTTGKPVIRFYVQEDLLGNIRFTPDGSRLILLFHSILAIHDAKTGQSLYTLRGHPAGFPGILDVAASAHAKRLVSSDKHLVRIWEPDVSQELFRLHPCAAALAPFGGISPNGKLVAMTEFTFGMQPPSPFVVDRIVPDEEREPFWRELKTVRALTFGPDSKRLITSETTSITVWDIEKRAPLFTLKNPESRLRFQQLVVTGDGVRIARGGRAKRGAGEKQTRGEVEIWEMIPNGKLLASRRFKEKAEVIAFSPNNNDLLAVGTSNRVELWHVRKNKIVSVLKGHTREITDLAFSPKGGLIATAATDKTVRLWNRQTGDVIHVLKSHNGLVSSIAFSHDGTRIVTGSEDKTIKLWDTATGQEIVSLVHGDALHQVRFTPDDRQIISLDMEGKVKVWDSTNK